MPWKTDHQESGHASPLISVRTETQNRSMDVVGQFPQLKTYNQGVLIFRLGVDVSRDDVVVALRDALAQIISRVPWLGECVIHEVQNDGISTLCKTVPFPPTVHDKGMLIVKDCSDVCPSYEELYHRGAPVSLLDGKVLCPLPGFPLSYDETDVAHAPILVLQVSFIKGGLLLNFSNQHNMVDGVGVFAFLTCLSIAMRGKEIPQNLIDHANIDGGNVIPLLDPRQPMRDHSHLLRSSNTIKVPQLPSPTPNSRWALFRVLRKNIPAIKLSATNKEEFVESVKYISTNDALCAFYWKRLAAVRVANRSVDSGSRSKFLRAIDARSAVGAPLGYIGQMVYHAATFFTYHELASPELTLSIIASRMRADLNESNTEWSVRSYATFLAGVSDKSTLVYGGGFNPMLDIGNSSMAQLDFTGLDFGILGKPEFLRRPNLSPAPGVMYVFGPEGPDRDLPVLVCLSDSDIDGLKADNEWGHVTEYVG